MKDGEPFENWDEAEAAINETLDRWRKVQEEAEAAYQALAIIRHRLALTKIVDSLKNAKPTA